MFADYSTLVFRYYEKKKTDNDLPVDLIEPKPAKLRDLCLIVCSERYDRKDETTLKKFFGNATDKEAFLKVIDRFEIDKFKPLITYLRDPSIKTHTKNIELLAWLIDFQPRPFVYGRKYVVAELENIVASLEAHPIQFPEKEKVIHPGPPVQSAEKQNHTESRNATSTAIAKRLLAIIATAIIFACIGIYALRRPTTYPAIPPGTQACMFWAGDHYQAVPCNIKLGSDTLVFALDSAKLLHFKKITRLDTITEKAVGAIWYVRYRGSYEFYTAAGYHPVDPQLRLRPVTAYILAKHISHE